mmetsp:Transcript_37796/g.103887  ORF Transcript_37796/g.103887 Transcript_37796/m.103887 type:complete len:224 (-) Transcript_37796:252-923(-)
MISPRRSLRSARIPPMLVSGASISISTMGSSKVIAATDIAFSTAARVQAIASSSVLALASRSFTVTSTTGMPPGPALLSALIRPGWRAATAASELTLPPRLGSSLAMSSSTWQSPSCDAGTSSTLAHGPACFFFGVLSPFVAEFNFAWYATWGCASGNFLILNSEDKRARNSSRCNMPMHERRCSPVSVLSSRRKPSLSSRQISSASINSLRSAGFMLSSCSA